MTPPASPASMHEAPPPQSRGRRAGQALGGVAVFAILIVAGLFRPPGATDLPPEVAALYAQLDAERGHVDVIFIGSSYTGYHIRPEILKQAAAERGLELHPVVLALPGLQDFEAQAVLERVLATPPPRLKWVALEYSRWDPELTMAQFRTSRAVWWQSPGRTRDFAAVALAHARDDGDTDDAFAPIAQAGLYLALNYSRIGSGSGGPPVQNQVEREARFAAWAARQAHPEFEAAYREDLRKHQDRLSEDSGWKSADDGRYEKLSARLFDDQIARVRSAGAEPVYILPPSMIKRSVEPRAVVIDFDQPAQFPDLFRPEDRMDSGHLSEEASQRYSRMLGHAFADAVTSGTLRTPVGR